MVKKKLRPRVKYGGANVKAATLVNVAAGNLEKASSMIAEKRYCPDIIQQIDSVSGLLKSARSELLKGHLESCLPARLKEDKNATVKELLKVYRMQ